mmetsp:Transcript_62587/g.104171  ORF Transcript_62587/g.104171 Transcript_62587/m.104171 type:complete len:233 (+) Transcript_62587:26-724(+)
MLSPADHALLWTPPLLYAMFVPICRYLLIPEASAQAVLAFRTAHNITLALYSAVVAVASLRALADRPISVHGMLCVPASPAPTLVASWYASKFFEWFDSLLLIAGRKSLSALHYNHHMSTATVVAAHIVGRERRTSIFDVPMLLNSVVHTLMYTYYCKPANLKPIKRLITKLQIMQHFLVLLAILYTSTIYLSGSAACDISMFANGLSLILYSMYLVQFVLFYSSVADRKAK